MAKDRLDKILASQNLGSRKEVRSMIRGGRATVNGMAVRRPETKADAEADRIELDGKAITFRRFLYVMMNKPAGVLSASRDSRARTVVDLLPPLLRRHGIFPAGRLDRDTEGLLLLTDDGGFAHRMLAPKSGVTKWYEAVLRSPVSPADAEAFRTGVVLSDRVCLPGELSILENGEHPRVRVKIHEGKFHQVKRMFLARGNRVLSLRRIRIGMLVLDPSLKPGQARVLEPAEVEMVFQKKHCHN